MLYVVGYNNYGVDMIWNTFSCEALSIDVKLSTGMRIIRFVIRLKHEPYLFQGGS